MRSEIPLQLTLISQGFENDTRGVLKLIFINLVNVMLADYIGLSLEICIILS